MNDDRELREALAFLRPETLTYDEWVRVGMALKDGGFACEVWDSWSAADTARYHKGECARKWAGYKGSAQPVTLKSIYELAYRQGWPGPDGHELGWEDVINARGGEAGAAWAAGGGRDGVLFDPCWVEAQELEIPETWQPHRQLIAYLEALFEPSENVGYVTQSWQKDGRWVPANGGAWDRTAGQLIEALAACGGDVGAVMGDSPPEAGAWIRFNPLDGKGCKNDNVTEFRFALVESDELDLGRQNALIRRLELPCAALVYSGGKSLHAIVRIDAADSAEYKRRVDYLYSVCQKNGLRLDAQNRNPSRLSRMPGVLRAGQKQCLLATNIGKGSWAEWKDWIEAETDDLPDTEPLASVWDNLPPLAPPLIEGVLRQGHKLLLAGPSKAGKSFALIELCIAIAEGRPWLGRFGCAQGRVLYINLELDRASCLHRFADVYAALGWPPAHLQSIDIWNLRGASVPMDKLAPKLIRRARKRDYLAVVLDPIYKVITGDENSADQMARFCNQFDLVCRELGCAMIYCHHHSKGQQGQKRSMDRASGSGVFARDPDAMLDLIELQLTDTVRAWAGDRAECAARMAALTAAGCADEIGPDEALSPVQLARACRQLLPPERCAALEARLPAARSRAAQQTAWRVDGTLREFARFAPVDLWFDYPVHRPDESGVLADLLPEGEAVASAYAKRAINARWQKKTPEQRRADRKASVDTAYSACASTDPNVTVYAMAEFMGVGERTVRNRIKETGAYWMDGEKVGPKQGPQGQE